MTIWGYVRISTTKQKIERQIDNIKKAYPQAVIISEAFTGTTIDRPAWMKLEKQLKPGDTVVFDEVSRMSRNAQEGMELYERLFNADINLVFLKEPHINSSVYKEKLQRQLEKHSNTGSKATDKLLDSIMEALHEYTIDLAREQIEIAFQTAQHEIDYLHQRTSEGVRKAQAAGKQVGRAKGATITTQKSRDAKRLIMQHCKDFGGSLSDSECMALAKIARNSFYKYKREIREELQG